MVARGIDRCCTVGRRVSIILRDIRQLMARVLALLKRRRSGVPDGGDFVTTSLAQGGQLVQAPFMYACEAGCSGDEPAGQDAVGEHALHRMYRARDGWVFLGGLQREMGKLRCVAGLENAPDEDAGEF